MKSHFFSPYQIRLNDEHNKPQNKGHAVGMHTIVFLVKNSGKIGVPETHNRTQKEDNKENNDVAIINGLGWFHCL